MALTEKNKNTLKWNDTEGERELVAQNLTLTCFILVALKVSSFYWHVSFLSSQAGDEQLSKSRRTFCNLSGQQWNSTVL